MATESHVNEGAGRRKVRDLPAAWLERHGFSQGELAHLSAKGPFVGVRHGYEKGFSEGYDEGRADGECRGRALEAAEAKTLHGLSLALVALFASVIGAALGFLIRGLG